jgi:cyclin A
MAHPVVHRQPFSDASYRVNQVHRIPVKDSQVVRRKNPPQMRLGSKCDPQDVYEYDYEIWQFLLQMETDQTADPHYLSRQPAFKEDTRLTLIDWIIAIHEEAQLHLETLFQAVRLVDLYLSRWTLDGKKLQLLGSAAMSLAVKAEENGSARGKSLEIYTGTSLTSEELAEMELDLFGTVDFVVTRPTLCDFLTRYMDLLQMASQSFFMGHYIGQLALLIPNVIGIRPSILAAAVVCLASVFTNDRPVWPDSIESYTSVRLSDIQSICQTMHIEIKKLNQLPDLAINTKFASDSLGRISHSPIPETINFA